MSNYTDEIDPKRLKKTKLTVYEQEIMCKENECNGRMLATGVVLTSNPPWYVHQCTHCQVFERISGNKFPRTVYKSE